MSAYTLDIRTLSFGGFVLGNMPNGLSSEDQKFWREHPDELRLLLGCMRLEQVPERMRFAVAGATKLDAIPAQKSVESFAGLRKFNYPPIDPDLFPREQLATPACTITSLVAASTWSEAGAVRIALGTDEPDVLKLSHLLAESSLTLTLPQAAEVYRQTQRGQATGLQTGNSAGRNTFFVRTNSKEYPAIHCQMFHHGLEWHGRFHRQVAHDRLREPDNSRFLFANFDVAKISQLAQSA